MNNIQKETLVFSPYSYLPQKEHPWTGDKATRQHRTLLRPRGPVLALQRMDSDASGIYQRDSWKMQEQNMHSSATEKTYKKLKIKIKIKKLNEK